MVGVQAGALLGGAVLVETVFAWPGLGRLTCEAVFQRDYPC
jgi:peptide/nickel transport system permease protein